MATLNFEETKKEFEELQRKFEVIQTSNGEELRALGILADNGFVSEVHAADASLIKVNPNTLPDADKILLDIYMLLPNTPEANIVRCKIDALFDELKRSSEEEATAHRDCQTLMSEMAITVSKVQTAWRYKEESCQEFLNTQKEVQNLIAVAKNTAAKEEEVRQKSNELKQKINLIEQTYQEDLERLRTEIQRDLEERRLAKRELEAEISKTLTRIRQLEEEASVQTTEIQSEEAKIESLRARVVVLQSEYLTKESEISQLEHSLKSKEENIERLKETVGNQERQELMLLEKLEKGKEVLGDLERMTKMSSSERESFKEVQTQQARETQLVDKEYENLLNLMPNYEAQITGLNNEILDIQDKLGYIASLVESVSKKKSEFTKHIKDLKVQVDLLADERSVISKQHENILQVIKIREEELNSELEQMQEEELRKQELDKVTKRQQEKVHQTRSIVADLERKIKTFENKVAGSKAIVKHLNEEAEALKAQQNKYSIDASNAHAKFYQCIEDIKVKNYIIGDLEEKNKVFGKKLKQQRGLYEAVRKDRNMYLKSLLDMKENMVTVNKEYQALAHQAKQVKDDIKFKGRRIREAERQHDFIGNENDELKVRKATIKTKIKTVEKNIEFYQAELMKLKNLISEAAFEKKKKLNVYENLSNEKSLLTSQYFKWHTELQKLFENVRSLETLLDLDEKHFNQLNERFDAQFERLKCLNEEQQEMRAVLSNGTPLKREIISMQKEMLLIQIKCAAFAERLKHPVNIHRWKKIEATEPEKFEKILRIHHLQRLLIDKNQEMKDLEATIGKKEGELLEVKTVMLRTAGKDFGGQVATLKEKIKDKSASMRQMVFEVAQARENITRLTLEINILKERVEGYEQLYFEQRRRQEEELKTQVALIE